MNKIFNYEEHETRATLWALRKEICPVMDEVDSEGSSLCAHAKGLISLIRRQNEELTDRISYSDVESAVARCAAENKDNKGVLVELLNYMQDGKYDSRLYDIQRKLQENKFDKLPSAMPQVALCEFNILPSQMFEFVAGESNEQKKQILKVIIDQLKEEVNKVVRRNEKPGNDILVSVLKNYYSNRDLILIPSRKAYYEFFAPVINLTARGSFDNFKNKIKDIFPRLGSM